MAQGTSGQPSLLPDCGLTSNLGKRLGQVNLVTVYRKCLFLEGLIYVGKQICASKLARLVLGVRKYASQN